MFKVLALVIFVFMFSSFVARADATSFFGYVTPVAPKEGHLNGRQFCEQFKSATDAEHGQFIPVSKDYAHPELGSIELYAWPVGGVFHPELPTFVVIDGGPGHNLHTWLSAPLIPGWNQIVYDSRGVGCSAMATFEDYANPALYTYSNLARDLEAVRKAFQVKKWSVYGISFGSIVSTVYAHEFPEAIQSLTLEGVASSQQTMENIPALQEKLQYVHDHLSSLAQSQVDAYFVDERSAWYGIFLLFSYFGTNDATQHAIGDFERHSAATSGDLNIWVRDQFLSYKGSLNQEPFNVDGRVYWMTFCENGPFENFATGMFILQDGQVVWRNWDNQSPIDTMNGYCQSVGVPEYTKRPYVSLHYPVQVPVTYFDGTEDHITDLGAEEHFLKAAQGPAQLLIFQGGGHNANLQTLAVYAPEAALFEKALRGERLGANYIKSYNEKAKHPISYREKNFHAGQEKK